MITISLSLALLCLSPDECYPVLVGPDTPLGTYQLEKKLVNRPGYGGDILQFHENARGIFAIHRVWTLKPNQRRIERIKFGEAKDRNITGGCVNVLPELYEKIMDCCSTGTVRVIH